MKPLPPRLDAREFERLANSTRLGAKAREMARLTLVEGRSMHSVAAGFGTIPQRVCLAVGSIQRVQASLTWGSSVVVETAVPERLLGPLSELVAGFKALSSGPVDERMIADLQVLLGEARRKLLGRA